ncbi:type I inositol polyphosphate 5-phosphatase 2-like isoform X2 [Telopea speciosissima]|uniref:type I inositol polyphosphate 5-phosphatase 2-like isoform X2 n=1 Tax=Telopea speciosissima TaxID=54955 RepID=UPI001CC4873A|nr:type I inositol polyphosphate 5-phosphatase 2-like isoform X2 [Telopea speciosissima]
MRTRKAKRPEAFWPSIVMKKWLNIKPKVHEFSEDEVDTETESEDDAYCPKDDQERMAGHQFCRMSRNQSVRPSQASGTPSKGYLLNHRRRKSETLRVQYINTKDVRVTIGTWNVAGRLPYEDLDIEEWLCMEEPADLYILGFQEVVPLNAGNVLGAEDNSPIPKWESIIRRTLNKSSQPETKHKSYSCPSSPVLRTSSTDDVLADEIGAPEVEVMSREPAALNNVSGFGIQGVEEIISTPKKFQVKRTYGIDINGILDWPERPLDMKPQAISSNKGLRRVLSSSARIGFDWMEKPLVFTNQDLELDGGLKRVHNSSGNLGLMWTEQQDRSEVLSFSDDSESSSEDDEDSHLEAEKEHCENGVKTATVKTRAKYVRIVSKQMVGIYVSVWVHRRLRRHINNLKVSPVGVGLMGYMGNKGSVSVSMSLFQTRLCYVCSHLTSGQKEGDQQRRNSDVYEILRRTQFSSVFDADQPQNIPSHDQIFWFGDLNYRLNMLDAEVRKLVAKKQWDELINSDQLSKELRSGRVFDGWKEGMINFPPTYKYELNSDTYVGESPESPKEGEKKRSPAWCDRILWLGKGIRQLVYKSAEIRLSDHRPVSSIFLIDVEVFDHRKLQRVLNFSNAAVHPEVFIDEWGD